eukprot:s182_g11.t1
MAGTGPYEDKYYKGYPMGNSTNPDHLPAVNVKACVAPCCIKAAAAGEGKQRVARRNAANLTDIHNLKEKCITPNRTDDGYIVYEGSLFIKHFHVQAQCAEGYKGKAMITACSKSGEPYKISGCTPKMCLAPTALEKQDYEVSEHSLEMRFFSVMAQCKGLGKAVVKQCKSDMEPYVIFGCLPFTCTTNKTSADEGYQVFEASKRLDSWDVTATCAPGFEGTAKVNKCEKPLMPYTLSGCSPILCAMAVHEEISGELRDYDVTVTDMHVPTFSVDVKCKGVAEAGVVPTAVPCFKSKEPFRLKNCKPMECASPRASMEDGYIVYEASRRMEKFDVKASCAKGYRGTAIVEICTEPGGPYLLSGCGAKRCVAPEAKAMKYYKLEVLSRELPSFNVGASCAEGASGVPQVTPCRKDGGTFSLSGCEPDACRSFPVNDFKSGYVVFEESLLLEDFNVSAKCAPGFKGKAVVETCTLVQLVAPESWLKSCGVSSFSPRHALLHGLGTMTCRSERENLSGPELEEWLHQRAASQEHIRALVVQEKWPQGTQLVSQRDPEAVRELAVIIQVIFVHLSNRFRYAQGPPGGARIGRPLDEAKLAELILVDW